MGCDSCAVLFLLLLKFQSTHPRGVRRTKTVRSCPRWCFNPRTHVGCDDMGYDTLLKQMFQSTHPRGVRRSCKHITIPISMFQSTHPRGVRLVASGVPSSTSWFQSTHPRGVRQSTKRNFIKRGSFNPRTHVGCDNTVWELSQRAKSFNPRTHVGCDQIRIYTINQS